MRNLLISLFVSAVIINALATLSVSQTPPPRECKIGGNVFDMNEASYVGATVTFSNSIIKKSSNTLTVEENEYELSLPEGVYEITVAQGLNRPPFQRSKLVHSCSNPLRINFWIHPYCISGCRSNIYSKTLSKDWAANSVSHIVLTNDGSKKLKDGTVYYSGLLTYNNYTILAAEILVDSKNKTVTAAGNVRVEDGKTRKHYDRVTMTFSKDGITFK